ncbi:hypothetical protein OCOJLMKI_1959 [Methylobacterium iners]|uniref:Uncharacterized protein n=1 Tax=Methylobacterium iners TaxID=418707 RepID=A0ABQ4RZ01_9HYPH|nr:hypothetical protein OCOJLMKI_1959 [Methylobacterium iners]
MIAEDRLSGLDRLITILEERRIEQMLHIAFRMAEDADTTEAEAGLREIEAAFARMRVQRMMQQAQSAGCDYHPPR